jgi:hypothetical protein
MNVVFLGEIEEGVVFGNVLIEKGFREVLIKKTFRVFAGKI